MSDIYGYVAIVVLTGIMLVATLLPLFGDPE